MSIELKELILIALNFWIGISYVVLSFVFARIFVVLSNAVKESEVPFVNGRARTIAIIGSALFLFGCGTHNFHLAFHIIPESIEAFGEKSLWLVMFWESILIAVGQAVGAPMLLLAGWMMDKKAKRLAVIKHLAEQYGIAEPRDPSMRTRATDDSSRH